MKEEVHHFTTTELRWFWPYHDPSLNGWAKEGLNLMHYNINKISELCLSSNTPLIVAFFPHPVMLVRNNEESIKVFKNKFWEFNTLSKKFDFFRYNIYKDHPYYQLLLNIEKNNNIYVLDLITKFYQNSNWQDMYIENDIHFNDKGLEFVADNLFQYISKETLINEF